MLPFPVAMLMSCPGICPIQPTADTQDDYYNLVSALLDATGQSNGTGYATASSRYGQTITYGGGAAISGSKFEFDGTDDYLTLPASAAHIPVIAMTIRAYGVVFDNLATDDKHLAGVWQTPSNRCWKISYAIAAQALVFGFSTDGTNSTNCSYPWVPTLGEPYDIEASWDGTTMRLYIDGLFVASQAFSGTPFSGSTAVFSVGAFNASGAWVNDLDGRIAAVQFTRDYARVTHSSGCYKRPKLPFPTAQSTAVDPFYYKNLLLLHGEGADGSTTFTDSGPLGLSPTVNGNAQIDTAQFKHGAASILLDGTGDYLTYANRSEFNLNGAFTIEGFIRFNSIAVSQGLITRWGGSGDQSWTMQWVTTNALRLSYTTDGDTDQIISGSFTPSTGTWYHTAICRDAYGNVRIFVGGTQIGSTATGVPNFFDNGNKLAIGAQEGAAGTYSAFVNGWFDEVRITAADRYVSNFTAPIGPFPNS